MRTPEKVQQSSTEERAPKSEEKCVEESKAEQVVVVEGEVDEEVMKEAEERALQRVESDLKEFSDRILQEFE